MTEPSCALNPHVCCRRSWRRGQCTRMLPCRARSRPVHTARVRRSSRQRCCELSLAIIFTSVFRSATPLVGIFSHHLVPLQHLLVGLADFLARKLKSVYDKQRTSLRQPWKMQRSLGFLTLPSCMYSHDQRRLVSPKKSNPDFRPFCQDHRVAEHRLSLCRERTDVEGGGGAAGTLPGFAGDVGRQLQSAYTKIWHRQAGTSCHLTTKALGSSTPLLQPLTKFPFSSFHSPRTITTP